MKKHLIALMFAGLIGLAALTGCVEIAEQPQPSDNSITSDISISHQAGSGTSSDPYSYWRGLYMYVSAGSITPTGLRLSMINNSEELTFGHGMPFRIDQHYNGEWRQAPFIVENVAWILPLLAINPNFINDENINWEHMHGQLSPGRYRIVRNFMEVYFYDPAPMWQRDTPEAYLYAFFIIEEDRRSANDDSAATAAHIPGQTGIGTSGDPYSYWQGLYMYVSAGSVTPSGIRLSIINTSVELTFAYGAPFHIDQYYNGKWRRVPVVTDILHHLMLSHVSPNFIYESDFRWEYSHGQLSPGQHRIVINFTIPGYSNPSWWQRDTPGRAYLYAAFIIEESRQSARDLWLAEQEALIARAFARFDGLDLMISEHSPKEAFDLLVDVMLDVSEEYKQEYFRHFIPGLPGTGLRCNLSWSYLYKARI